MEKLLLISVEQSLILTHSSCDKCRLSGRLSRWWDVSAGDLTSTLHNTLSFVLSYLITQGKRTPISLLRSCRIGTSLWRQQQNTFQAHHQKLSNVQLVLLLLSHMQRKKNSSPTWKKRPSYYPRLKCKKDPLLNCKTYKYSSESHDCLTLIYMDAACSRVKQRKEEMWFFSNRWQC